MVFWGASDGGLVTCSHFQEVVRRFTGPKPSSLSDVKNSAKTSSIAQDMQCVMVQSFGL